MDDKQRQIQELKEKLEFLREQMPITPLDAERNAMEIGLIEEQLAELYEGSDLKQAPKKSSPSMNSLTDEIKSITDELMEIEIRMIKAEINNDESERTKLMMSANALKARRQSLIDEVKEMNSSPAPVQSDLEKRVEALEKEVADIKTLLYQILTK